MRFCSDGRSRSNKEVKNVAMCRDTGMQFYVYQIATAKDLWGGENLAVEGKISDVSRERRGNIVQGDL